VEDPRWNSLFLEYCTPWEGPTLGWFVKSCSPWEGLSLWRSLWRTAMRGTFTLEQGKSVKSPPPEEHGAAETMCDELTATPIPRPPSLPEGRRERNGSEVEPRMKGGVGGRCVKIWIYFSLSYSDLIGDELNSLFSPSSACFVHDGNW